MSFAAISISRKNRSGPRAAANSGRDFQGQIVTGDDGVERFAGCVRDDTLHRLGHVLELDVKSIGDCGNDRVMALRSDDEPRAERGRSHLVSGNAIALLMRDQENPGTGRRFAAG